MESSSDVKRVMVTTDGSMGENSITPKKTATVRCGELHFLFCLALHSKGVVGMHFCETFDACQTVQSLLIAGGGVVEARDLACR